MDPKPFANLQERLAGSCPDLAPNPAAQARFEHFSSQEDANLDELARVLETDVAMSAKVLRMVNNASIPLAGEVASVRKALGILGIGPVQRAIAGLGPSEPRAPRVAEVDRKMWMRALARALTTRELSRRKNLGAQAELLEVGALLSDLGRKFLLDTLGESLLRIADLAREAGQPIEAAEAKALGSPTAAFGKELAQKWRFPENLVRLVAATPEDVAKTGSSPLAWHMLRIADFVARSNFGTPFDFALPQKDFSAMRAVDLTPHQLDALADEVGQQVRDTLRIYSEAERSAGDR